MRRAQGFTLIELLITIGVAGVVLVLITDLFVGSLRTSGDIQSRNDLIQETQVAQQLVAARVREAWYVYPPGTTFSLASSGYTTKNPSGGYQWRVGTDPILALILPPKQAGACSSSTKASCYTFYAYYPVLRRDITSNATGANNPGRDGVNDASTWVLMQYIVHFDTVGAPSVYPNPPAPPNPPTGVSAQILADYVQPAALTPSYTMFGATTQTAPASPAPGAWGVPPGVAFTWVQSVQFNLRAQRTTSGRTIRLPGTTEPFALTLYPRNLGH